MQGIGKLSPIGTGHYGWGQWTWYNGRWQGMFHSKKGSAVRNFAGSARIWKRGNGLGQMCLKARDLKQLSIFVKFSPMHTSALIPSLPWKYSSLVTTPTAKYVPSTSPLNHTLALISPHFSPSPFPLVALASVTLVFFYSRWKSVLAESSCFFIFCQDSCSTAVYKH